MACQSISNPSEKMASSHWAGSGEVAWISAAAQRNVLAIVTVLMPFVERPPGSVGQRLEKYRLDLSPMAVHFLVVNYPKLKN